MTERIDFTMARLSKLKPFTQGRRVVYDFKSPGLCISVTPSGAATFYYYGRINGRPSRVCIGPFPAVTVDAARDRAKIIAADVAVGKDPAEEKRRRRAELTVGELFALYVEQHGRLRRKPASLEADAKRFDLHFADWKSRKASTITNAIVRKFHADIGNDKGRVIANRLVSLLSMAYRVGAELGRYHGENPCKGIRLFSEKSRERFLQPDELPRFLHALDNLKNQQAADAFRLMLFTGVRKSNVFSARWCDIDLQQAVWVVPDTKNGDPQRVHLSAPAVDVLSRIKATAGDAVYVFPSRTKTAKVGHLQDVAGCWREVCKMAGIDGLHTHDLRRSLGSWMAAGGQSLPVIGKALGHRSTAATSIYARLHLDPVRTAVDAAVAAMMAAGRATEGAEQ